MPSSEPCNIPIILEFLRRRSITSILDVGVGCGKYALLFREYLDGHWTGCAFHDPTTWKIRLIGVEAFPEYLTPVHEYLYDSILIGDYEEVIHKINQMFDLMFFGDVLEHFNKGTALRLIHESCQMLNPGGLMVISTPNFDTNLNPNRIGACENNYELHKCRLYPADFNLPGFKIRIDEGRLLTVFMEKL